MANNEIKFSIRLSEEVSRKAKPAVSALKQLSDASNGLSRAVTSASGSLRKLTNDFKNLINNSPLASLLGGTAVIATMTALTRNMVEFARNAVMASEAMKQNELAMTVMLKSSEKAKKLMQDIETFALATPFDTAELTSSAKLLTAFGFDYKNILPMMNAIGNAVGMMGGGKAQMDGIVLALGQIQAKGKLAGQELMQLTNQNISARKYLQEHFQKSSAEIEQMLSRGAVSAKDAITAIVNGMERDFMGGMDTLSETIPGIVSNISESFEVLEREIGERIAETFNVKEHLEDLRDELEHFTAVMRQHGFKQAWDELVPPWLGAALASIAAIISTVVIGALFALGTALAGVWGIGIATFGTIIALAGALGAAGYLMWDNWDDICAGISGLWDGLAGSFAVAVARVKALAYDMFNSVLEAAKPLADFIGMGLPDAISEWTDTLKAEIAVQNKVITDAKNRIFKGDQKASGAWQNMKRRATGYRSKIEEKVLNIGSYDGSRNFNGIEDADVTESAGGAGGGGGANNRISQLTRRVRDEAQRLGTGIVNAIGGAFARGENQLETEIARVKELIAEATAAGLDTTVLKAKLDEYTKVMRDKLVTEWQRTWREIELSVNELRAKNTDDKRLTAEVKYQQELLRIEKEKERIRREAYNGTNETQARALADAYEREAITATQRERDKNIRNAALETNKARKEILEAEYGMYRIGYAKMTATKRQYLAEEKRINQEIINDVNTTIEQRAEAMTRLKEIYDEERKHPQTLVEAWKNAAQDMAHILRDLGTSFKTFADNTMTAIHDNFSDGFFEAMKGNFKGLSDAFGNMAQAILKEIANFLASQLVARFFSVLGGGVGNVFGGYSSSPNIIYGLRASGGAVDYGKSYIVGERGPELFTPDRPGRIHNTFGAQGKADAPIINLNIQNNTGSDMKAETRSRWDGTRYIIDTVLTAVATNQGGMRDVIKGVR